VKTILDTTHRGLSADVLPRGTAGGTYTLTIRATDAAMSIEVEATVEGLGDLVGAVLEQIDNDTFADLIADQVGHRMAGELGQALVDVAAAREKAAALRVTER